MSERPKNIPEQFQETLQLPELQDMVIKSFRELFKNPDFVEKIKIQIADIPEYIERMQLMGALNRITWLQSDAAKVTQRTKNTLGNFLASLDPEVLQGHNPDTTA